MLKELPLWIPIIGFMLFVFSQTYNDIVYENISKIRYVFTWKLYQGLSIGFFIIKVTGI